MRAAALLTYLFLLTASVSAQDLNPTVYDQYLGTYQTADGKELVVGRSFVRLFSFDPQTFDYRGLARLNDSTWASGNTILADTQKTAAATLYFYPRGREQKVDRLLIAEKGRPIRAASRATGYREQEVTFQNGDITLAGTLLVPNQPRKVPAVVLVHGSGEQNRHGYASYMRLIADYLAKNGIAVLTYDKRGCGSSTGNWQTASFRDLATDAIKGGEMLAHQPGVDPRKIGFGGSSQAGWVLAKLSVLQPGTPFLFCLSGAGMGTTAAQQNLYNTATELRATGATETQVMAVLQAWRRLYAYVRSYRTEDARRLDAAIATAATTSLARDYLPPAASAISPLKKDQWFQALEVEYDPRGDWANYRGSLLAMFGELDASTPVQEVSTALVRSLKIDQARRAVIKIYPRANHLLLRAHTRSDREFGQLTSFEPHFLPDLSNWLLEVSRSESPAVTQVKKLERAWLAAYETADSTAMKNIVADNFTITFPGGAKQTKQLVIRELPNLLACCPSVRIYTALQRATDYGKSVRLTGVVTTEFYQNGVLKVIRQRYTDTYAKAGGRWQVLASELTDYK